MKYNADINKDEVEISDCFNNKDENNNKTFISKLTASLKKLHYFSKCCRFYVLCCFQSFLYPVEKSSK